MSGDGKCSVTVRRDAAGWSTVNRKSLRHNSGIKPRVYVRRSTMYEKLDFVSRNWRNKNRTVHHMGRG